MDAHFPTIGEPATPDHVLAVLRDEHRQECQFDPEVDPQALLSFESTVAEWREACDLLGWRQFAFAGGVLARWLYLRRNAMSPSIGIKGIQAPKESS